LKIYSKEIILHVHRKLAIRIFITVQKQTSKAKTETVSTFGNREWAELMIECSFKEYLRATTKILWKCISRYGKMSLTYC
jgi:hypothetical protein